MLINMCPHVQLTPTCKVVIRRALRRFDKLDLQRLLTIQSMYQTSMMRYRPETIFIRGF